MFSGCLIPDLLLAQEKIGRSLIDLFDNFMPAAQEQAG